jgi:hypothetical protein
LLLPGIENLEGDWPGLFKAPIEVDAFVGEREWLEQNAGRTDFAFLTGRVQKAVFVLQDGTYESSYQRWISNQGEQQLFWWYFEELAALMRAYFYRHYECANKATHCHWATNSTFSFSCPAAVSLGQAGAWANVTMEPRRWPEGRIRGAAKKASSVLLMHLVTKNRKHWLKPQEAELVIRAVARAQLAEALCTFIAASPQGCGGWFPDPDKCLFPVIWSFDENQENLLTIFCKADASLMASLAQQCDALCPVTQAEGS